MFSDIPATTFHQHNFSVVKYLSMWYDYTVLYLV